MSYKKGDVVVVKFFFVLKEGILPKIVVKESERMLKRLLGFDFTSV